MALLSPTCNASYPISWYGAALLSEHFYDDMGLLAGHHWDCSDAGIEEDDSEMVGQRNNQMDGKAVDDGPRCSGSATGKGQAHMH